MLVTHWSLCQPKQYSFHKLNDIQSVRAIRHGKTRGFNHDSTRCSIKVFFKSGQAIRILSSKSSLRVKKELLCLRRFLEIELDRPISIQDQSVVEDELKTLKQRILKEYRKLKEPVVKAKAE